MAALFDVRAEIRLERGTRDDGNKAVQLSERYRASTRVIENDLRIS